MILARIAKAIRDQNWFAVALEFVIVIGGVVVGFQVTAWNGEQSARATEVRLLSQLESDVGAEIERKQDWIDVQIQNNAQLASAIDLIQNPERGDAITRDQCDAAWQSHIVVPYPSQLPTLDEIMAISGLASFRDPQLRSALLVYRSEMDEIRELNTSVQRDFVTTVDDFAEAMPRRLDIETNAIDAACQLDLMRANQTLQNQLISNYGRAGGLVRHAQRELALLEAVQTAMAPDTD